MKILLALSFLMMSLCSFAQVSCEAFENGELEVIQSSRDIISKDNWKEIDVIVGFDWNECHDAIKQELLEVNGELYWRFRSVEDDCDGGNTYGSIYTFDLITPVAHIYDGDVYCDQASWNKEYLTSNHKCDFAAEEHAQEKMEDFGFDFSNLTSSLVMRKYYSYSEIKVSGTIDNKDGVNAIVTVLTNLKTCDFVSTKITSIKID